MTPDRDYLLEKNLQTKRLVIDLDATFVSTKMDMPSYNAVMKILNAMPDKEKAKEINDRIYVFTVEGHKMWTLLRPGSLEFIEFASLYFSNVHVWSAGQQEYVHQITNILFPPHVSKPGVVFNWDDCHQGGSGAGGQAASPSNGNYIAFTKPLLAMAHILQFGDTDESKISGKQEFLEPDMAQEILAQVNTPARIKAQDSLKNVLMLDDRDDIAEHNMGNLILIPAFEPKMTARSLSEDDGALNSLIEWLLSPEVLTSDDVRTLDKNSIF